MRRAWTCLYALLAAFVLPLIVTDAHAVPQADLTITVTDGVGSASPGTSVTYAITASNLGPSDEPAATVTNSFPPGLTCSWTCTGAGGGSCTAAGAGDFHEAVGLPAGGSVVYSATCLIPASFSSPTLSMDDNAGVSGSFDPELANNYAYDSDLVVPLMDLGVTITDGVASAVPGGSETYTVTVTNAGPADAPAAAVTHGQVNGSGLTCTWTCVGAGGGTCPAAGSDGVHDTFNLPVGSSLTYAVSCAIDASATGTLHYGGWVLPPAGAIDPNDSNDDASDSNTMTPQADLSITVTDGTTTATPGGSVTYTITASNSGPSNAPGTSVTDLFPAGLTCSWSCTGTGGGTCTASGSGNIADNVNLPSGGGVTYTAACAVPPAATGTLANTATVGAAGGITDPNPGNNSSIDTDTVPGATLSGSMSVSGDFVPGSGATYTVVVTNAGPGAQADEAGNEFTDVVPAGLTLVSAAASSGMAVANIGTNTVTWNGPLPASASVTITITARVTATSGTTISNQGTLAYDADGNGTNESTAVTDDPAVAGGADATRFVVAASVPTLSDGALGMLALLLTLGAVAWRERM